MTQNNEWIEWTGGECPFPPDKVAEIEYFLGTIKIQACDQNRQIGQMPNYIKRYRIYEPPIVAELRKVVAVAKEALEYYAVNNSKAKKALQKIAEMEGIK